MFINYIPLMLIGMVAGFGIVRATAKATEVGGVSKILLEPEVQLGRLSTERNNTSRPPPNYLL
jgi:hypothetical protein